jgi:hypothetical protein
MADGEICIYFTCNSDGAKAHRCQTCSLLSVVRWHLVYDIDKTWGLSSYEVSCRMLGLVSPAVEWARDVVSRA